MKKIIHEKEQEKSYNLFFLLTIVIVILSFIGIKGAMKKGEKKNEKNHEFVYGNYINIRIDKYGKCRE